MTRPSEPLFLARRTYRRRRIMDAAKILPIMGMFLFFLPLLWGQGSQTARALLYVFSAWAFLIVAAFVIARALRDVIASDESADE